MGKYTAYKNLKCSVKFAREIPGRPFKVLLLGTIKTKDDVRVESHLSYPDFIKFGTEFIKAEFEFLKATGNKESLLFGVFDKEEDDHHQYLEGVEYERANKGL